MKEETMMSLKRIFFRTALLIGAVTLLSLAGCALPGAQGTVMAATRATDTAGPNQMTTGTDSDGYFWFIWRLDSAGNATITHNVKAGNYSTSWSGINNFTSGKGLPTGGTSTVFNYSGSFNGGSNGYLAVYGWMESPLVEYYILDTWGDWDPKTWGELSAIKGSVDSDGGTYNIYTRNASGANITGTSQNFTQYWSIRTAKRTIPATGNGTNTITVANHFAKWQQLGMTLGSFQSRDYQVIETEGYQSSGSSDITMSAGSTTTPTKAWTGLNTGMMNGSYSSGEVTTLAVDSSGTVYAGGSFTVANNQQIKYITKGNNSSWSSVGGGIPNVAAAVAIDSSNTVYAAYLDSSTSGFPPRVVKLNGSSWTDTGFPGTTYTNITTLACSGTTLYAGGYKGLFVYNGSSWTDISSTGNGSIAYVNSIAFDNANNVYAGCSVNFTDSNGTTANRIAKYNTGSKKWTAMGTGMDDYVDAVAYDTVNNILYAGGWFKTAGGVAAKLVAKWDGSSWSAVGTGLDGVAVNGLAMWNRTAWSSVGNGISGGVTAFAYDKTNDLLYAGGAFDNGVSLNISVYK
jgi:hypothetical protein